MFARVKPLARAFSTAGAGSRVLVTGATGQIGLELVPFLRQRYGADAVVATDIKVGPQELTSGPDAGPYHYLDVQDGAGIHKLVVDYGINTIIHLASLLSAVGERNPQVAMKVNARGCENVLEAAAAHKCKIFIPSTIAVYGPTTPRDNTPNETIMRPTTIYGVTKVYGELLGEYYASKYGVDFRSIRYPGIISNKALPGGGTTDYAVEIFYEAVKKNAYTCFLGPSTTLPMMYMPDCIRGTVELLEAPSTSLSRRVYNMTAVSFTPEEIAAAVARIQPGFSMSYKPDFRQAIADTWPRTIDDSAARQDWGWKHAFGVDEMASDMITELRKRLL